ncbi:hypothetical protein P3T40_007453 [Paraburkholderia sp. EB58]|jgi:hypothetical protein|uniref:DUF4148 domain-containing protein n=1 Tax=Paraburkholderia sp. EB58 TaxID=3035125 RepID=UPI003D2047DB
MKLLLYALFTLSVLADPAASFAQQSSPIITREQVKGELTLLEKAGYHPGRRNYNYPDDIRDAQARVAAQNRAASPQTNYSPAVGGSSQLDVPSK